MAPANMATGVGRLEIASRPAVKAATPTAKALCAEYRSARMPLNQRPIERQQPKTRKKIAAEAMPDAGKAIGMNVMIAPDVQLANAKLAPIAKTPGRRIASNGLALSLRGAVGGDPKSKARPEAMTGVLNATSIAKSACPPVSISSPMDGKTTPG